MATMDLNIKKKESAYPSLEELAPSLSLSELESR